MVWFRKAAAHGNQVAASNIDALEHPAPVNSGRTSGGNPNYGGGGGMQFCNGGISNGMGGCVSYSTGQFIDPTTGKPLY